jgi:hypothetical protein
MHARAFGATAALAALAAAAQPADRCMQNPGIHYDAGVAYHLEKKGIPYSMRPGSGVCVAAAHSSDLDAAAAQIDNYYWEVAYLLRNACEERAVVEWATREGLRFDVSEVVDLARKPAGRMFHLRSYTQEEVVSNRRRLDEAPGRAACEIG